jgi:hypothetical protein
VTIPDRPPHVTEQRWGQLWGQRTPDIPEDVWARRMVAYAAQLTDQGWPPPGQLEEASEMRLEVDPGAPDPFARELLARALDEQIARATAGAGHPSAPALGFLADLAGAIRGSAGAVSVRVRLGRDDRELAWRLVMAGWQRARAEQLPAEPGLRRVLQAMEGAGWAPEPDPQAPRRLDRVLGHSGPLEV